MKRSSKILVSSGLLASFSFMTIFCCCLVPSAQASTAKAYVQEISASKAHSCCAGKSQKAKSCSCKQQNLYTAEKQTFELAKNILRSLQDIKITFLSAQPLNSALQHSFLLGQSPPLLASISVPLYLKNSNLRL